MNNWLGFPLTDRSHTAFDLAVLANLNNIVAGFIHEGSRELKWTDNLIYRWLAVYSHAISDHFILMPLLVSSFSARCFSRILLFLLLLVPVWEVFYAFVIPIQPHVSCQKMTGMKKREREGRREYGCQCWVVDFVLLPYFTEALAISCTFSLFDIFYGLHTFRVLYISITWIIKLVPISALNWSSQLSAYSFKKCQSLLTWNLSEHQDD